MKIPSPRLSLGYRFLGFSPSLLCDANCFHCLFSARQRRSGRHDPVVLRRFFSGISKNIKVICLTGGEPFADLDLLFYLAHRMRSCGRNFAIVTNGLWSLRNEPTKILTRLKKYGLNSVSVSFDDYHSPSLDKDELIRLLESSAACGIAISIKSCGKKSESAIREIKKHFQKKSVPVVVEHFSLDHVGMATNLATDLVRVNSSQGSGCTMLAKPVVLHDGTFISCCSAIMPAIRSDWLVRGNIRSDSLRRLLSESESDFRLVALAALGPRGMARVAGIKYDSTQTPCENCVRILNDETSRRKIEDKLEHNKALRKEVIGRFLLLSFKLAEDINKIDGNWRRYKKRAGIE